MLTEGEKDDRLVHCGQAPMRFSEVQGTAYEPCTGLALQRWDADTYKAIC